VAIEAGTPARPPGRSTGSRWDGGPVTGRARCARRGAAAGSGGQRRGPARPRGVLADIAETDRCLWLPCRRFATLACGAPPGRRPARPPRRGAGADRSVLHGVGEEGVPVGEIAERIASHLGVQARRERATSAAPARESGMPATRNAYAPGQGPHCPAFSLIATP